MSSRIWIGLEQVGHPDRFDMAIDEKHVVLKAMLKARCVRKSVFWIGPDQSDGITVIPAAQFVRPVTKSTASPIAYMSEGALILASETGLLAWVSCPLSPDRPPGATLFNTPKSL
jgi:hypothetical protein